MKNSADQGGCYPQRPKSAVFFGKILNHLGRGCVANITHMLQASSFNQTRILFASNSFFPFSAWRGEYT